MDKETVSSELRDDLSSALNEDTSAGALASNLIYTSFAFSSPIETDLESPSEFSDLYTGLSFNAYASSPVADESSDSFYTKGSSFLDDETNSPISDAGDEIKRNHVQDYILKEYLKITAGIDVRERALPLFTKGCSYASSADGGGLGTSSSDFDYIVSHSNNVVYTRDGSAGYVSDGYINQIRSDILNIIAAGIDSGAFGDLDLETSSSSNVASKLRQSFLFSPEKYLNQAFCPTLFERIFCVLVDPDGFDLDYEEMSQETVESLRSSQALSESDGADYISEVFSFFTTVEFLPIQSDLIN